MGEFITGPEACSKIGAPGERIQRPHLEKYEVFIQSVGSGARHLDATSTILYKVWMVSTLLNHYSKYADCI